MKKKSLIFVTLISMLWLSGCGSKDPEPAAIHEETDKCATCNMMVEDGPHAAQLLTKDGKVLKFDDIGCLNEWEHKNGTDNVNIEFVRDHNSKKWVKVEDAIYVYDPSFVSPMAYGIYSFESRSSAEDFAKQQGKGKVMSADDLASHGWERNKAMMEEMKSKMKKDGGMHSSDKADQGMHG